MKHTGGKFIKSNVKLDGEAFDDCTFTGCKLIYSGGKPPSFTGCSFDACGLAFDGAASNTVALLDALASPSSGMQGLVSGAFRNFSIKKK